MFTLEKSQFQGLLFNLYVSMIRVKILARMTVYRATLPAYDNHSIDTCFFLVLKARHAAQSVFYFHKTTLHWLGEKIAAIVNWTNTKSLKGLPRWGHFSHCLFQFLGSLQTFLGLRRGVYGVHHSVGLLWSLCICFFICVCFYKGNMPRAKVEHFVSVHNYNLNNETNFFKRFTVQMTSTQLNALLTELENWVKIPETIPKAVSVIGKNINPEN